MPTNAELRQELAEMRAGLDAWQTRRMADDLNDYRDALAGYGPRAGDADKPSRLVYDLIGKVEAEREQLAEVRATLECSQLLADQAIRERNEWHRLAILSDRESDGLAAQLANALSRAEPERTGPFRHSYHGWDGQTPCARCEAENRTKRTYAEQRLQPAMEPETDPSPLHRGTELKARPLLTHDGVLLSKAVRPRGVAG